jgi:hypothetical protein
MLNLSQQSLSLLETNPTLFQCLHIEQKESPSNPETRHSQEVGNHFHLLMKQLLMGLPVEPLLNAYPQMHRWISSLQLAAPEIFSDEPDTFKECDHQCTLICEGHLLSVVYNLLIADNNQAQIIEWTTATLPNSPLQLENDWKTRLYLYVLAETSDYLPEEISFTYWFVQFDREPVSFRFEYDESLHRMTHSCLTALLNKLNEWLKAYQQEGKPFPLPKFIKPYSQSPKREELLNLDDIKEVRL